MGNRVCTISNHFNPISASTVVGRPHRTCRKSWTCLYLRITYASCSSSTKCTVGLAKKKPVRSSMIYATQNTYRSSGVKCRSFINAKYAPPNVWGSSLLRSWNPNVCSVILQEIIIISFIKENYIGRSVNICCPTGWFFILSNMCPSAIRPVVSPRVATISPV